MKKKEKHTQLCDARINRLLLRNLQPTGNIDIKVNNSNTIYPIDIDNLPH